MSAFLGQIHFWLYKKIRLLIAREELLLLKAREAEGDFADELHESALSMYGAPIPESAALESIIDHGNIHGWLQGQIETAAVREATFIKDLTDALGDEGQAIVLDAFAEQGRACGAVAADELPETTAPFIYNVMQNYYLNGMPCDAGDVIEANDDDCYSWEGTHLNQLGSWRKAGVDPAIMTKAYQAWFGGFVSAIAPDFVFTVNTDKTPVIYAITRK